MWASRAEAAMTAPAWPSTAGPRPWWTRAGGGGGRVLGGRSLASRHQRLFGLLSVEASAYALVVTPLMVTYLRDSDYGTSQPSCSGTFPR